jgi:8-oxo-dGTP pyrophosphatase MutT (NUDIX family)
MRPAGIESNHFAYHLDQLIKLKVIVKTDARYTLSPQGLSAIDRLSQEKMTERLQPHIVTAIDLTNEAGQTLLFKRNFQPYLHRVGFPLGKTHYQEDIMTAAQRELQEKTGLTGIPLTQRGLAYIEARQAGETISKVLYHVFHGVVRGAPEVTMPEYRGNCFWADAQDYGVQELMPGFLKLKALLASQEGLFFAEITEDLDRH